MLSFLPSVVIGCLAVTGFVLNTLFWCISLYAVTLLKVIVPNRRWRSGFSRVLIHIAEAWIDGNSTLMRLTQKTVWEVDVDERLRRDGSYLVISNHRSAVDIPVLQRVFRRRIPFLKFFLKRQLLYVPFLGVAWWALDFPFMRRVSRDAIAKRPELRNQDVENAKRACQKFRGQPVSILNYVEGTRFTEEKRAKRGSPFQHLLAPRAGGIAAVFAGLGDELTGIVDVTVLYEGNRVQFWDFFCGRVTRIVVHARLLPVPAVALGGDYAADEAYRARFQEWLNGLWREKDEHIALLLGRLT